MPVKKIAIGVTLFLLLIVIFQNLTVIDVKILFWKLNINLLLVMLLPFLVGIVMGWFFRSFYVKNQQETKKKTIENSNSLS